LGQFIVFAKNKTNYSTKLDCKARREGVNFQIEVAKMKKINLCLSF